MDTRNDKKDKYPWAKHWSTDLVVHMFDDVSTRVWNAGIETHHLIPIYKEHKKALLHGHPKTMIDIGCADGNELAALNSVLADVYPIYLDYSIELLKMARQHQPDKAFLRADAFELPFKDRAIDIVMCKDLLCSVADYKKLFPEICRITGQILMLNLKIRTKGHTVADMEDSFQYFGAEKIPYIVINIREFGKMIKEQSPNARILFAHASILPLNLNITKIPGLTRVVNTSLAIDLNYDGKIKDKIDVDSFVKDFLMQCKSHNMDV